ncbi:hypothetical protein [Spirosoma gilvum]
MDLSDELLDQIGAFLSGQMTATEQEQFERRMEEDSDLRDEVAIHRDIRQGLQFMSQKERFRQMHEDLAGRGLLDEEKSATDLPVQTDTPIQLDEPVEPKHFPFPAERPRFGAGLSWYAMAACTVLALGLGWVVYRYQSQTSRTAEAFNSAFSTTLKPAPVTSPDPDRLGAAPSDSITTFDSVRLQGAITSLQRNDMRAALNQLDLLVKGTSGHWQASAQWYLALAYLKNRQTEQAEQLIQQIASLSGHPYQPEAQRLLKQLNVTNGSGQ